MEQRLESFLTLCDTMHYGRAAEKLHLSQPAVSKHIQSLENQYGVSLFTYANRRLQKTREGEVLQQYVQTLRYNEEKLMEKLCQQSTRLLRIGATKSIGEYVLLPNIKRFLSFPEHEIEFLVDNTERLLERLDHSELDFVVLEGIFHKQHYDWILFRNEPYIGICAKNHPFAGREVNVEELLAERIICGKKDLVQERYLNENWKISALPQTLFRSRSASVLLKSSNLWSAMVMGSVFCIRR